MSVTYKWLDHFIDIYQTKVHFAKNLQVRSTTDFNQHLYTKSSSGARNQLELGAQGDLEFICSSTQLILQHSLIYFVYSILICKLLLNTTHPTTLLDIFCLFGLDS